MLLSSHTASWPLSVRLPVQMDDLQCLPNTEQKTPTRNLFSASETIEAWTIRLFNLNRILDTKSYQTLVTRFEYKF